MTPAERALLLAVAKLAGYSAHGGQSIWPFITAVEAEAAPQPEPDVCPTCGGVCNPFPDGSGYCPDCGGTGKKEAPHD